MIRDSKTLSLNDLGDIVNWEFEHLVPQCQMPPTVQEQYKNIILHLGMCKIAGEELSVPQQYPPIDISLDKDIIKEDNMDKREEKSSEE